MKAKKFNRKFLLSYWLLMNLQSWRWWSFFLQTTLHTIAHTFSSTLSLLLPLIYRQSIYKWQVRIQVRINFKWLDGRKNIYVVQRFSNKYKDFWDLWLLFIRSSLPSCLFLLLSFSSLFITCIIRGLWMSLLLLNLYCHI